MQAALAHLMPYTQEFFSASPMETAAAQAGVGADMAKLKAQWDSLVDDTVRAATLQRPASAGFVSTGKLGVHSEHLGYVLAEMQCLARAHPQAVW